MKVFFVNTNKAWGGGEKWHFDTAIFLHNSGFEIAILTCPDCELYKRSMSAGIATIPVSISNLSFLNPFRVHNLKEKLKLHHPDIIILNLSSDLKTAGIAAKLAGVRHIIYRRGNAKPIKNHLINRMLFNKVVTRIIVNSEETKRSVLKYNRQLAPALINVMYNGIDLRKYDGMDFERIYTAPGDRIILGSAGRLSHEKGHHLLIELATILKQRQVSFTLLIAGEGPMKDALIKETIKRGLDGQIVFTGFIENIKSVMETIDIFILPSLWEGFGYVSTEAMASRKPVVAFRTGSNPEIIEENKTGFLAGCYNVTELADKVVQLVNDPVLRKSFGNSGRERVEKLFSSEVTYAEIKKYLTELTSNTNSTLL